MKITDLVPDDTDAVHQAAALLVEAFCEHWPNAWPDMDSAPEEVREAFGAGRVNCVAWMTMAESWAGQAAQYGGR